MCGFSKPPSEPPRQPEAPRAPDAAATGDANKRRRAAANTETILTGSRGVGDQATTSQKTLLGQ